MYVMLEFERAAIEYAFDSILCCCFVVLSRLSYKQDKRMDELNIFIDYHYKSIVSII